MGHDNKGRRFGRSGGWQQADLPDPSDVPDWFAGRLPIDWFAGSPLIEIDREEIVVIGELPLPKPDKPTAGEADAPTEQLPKATKEGAIARFRESTRPARMQIAGEAQHRYGRNVAWGVSVDGERIMFTQLAVPVMTRLRQPERKVLDTLVDSGVARSRADALAWTVKLAGKHAESWLEELRSAMRKVDDLRSEGPQGL
ncbi:hypothetical protein ACWEKT_03490 [Nocardia takedensis]|uniref:hypothetical protein n=1 Tax=Nocardia takedensis TaxID=259390 RepID=UPI0002FA4A2E|nr:hypothetical protein [Nocardia takedensis]